MVFYDIWEYDNDIIIEKKAETNPNENLIYVIW